MIKRIEAKFIRLTSSFFYFFLWIGFNLFCRIIPYFLYTFEVEGKENVPKKGRCILAANHQNFFDGFFVVAPLGPFRKFTFLIAKRSLRTNIMGYIGQFLARLINTVVLDDEKDAYSIALKRLNKILNHGGSIVIFPEGNVSNRKIPRKFKGGVAKLSIDSTTKVVPVYVNGTYCLRDVRNWLKRPKVSVKYGKPLELYRYAEVCNYDLDEMAALLRDKVIELSGVENCEENRRLSKFAELSIANI